MKLHIIEQERCSRNVAWYTTTYLVKCCEWYYWIPPRPLIQWFRIHLLFSSSPSFPDNAKRNSKRNNRIAQVKTARLAVSFAEPMNIKCHGIAPVISQPSIPQKLIQIRLGSAMRYEFSFHQSISKCPSVDASFIDIGTLRSEILRSKAQMAQICVCVQTIAAIVFWSKANPCSTSNRTAHMYACMYHLPPFKISTSFIT